MSYNYLENYELEKALQIYMEKLESLEVALEEEEVSVTQSLDRITSEPIYAHISSPHYNACAMDGIALSARKTFGATDTTPAILKENVDFIRVDTGDPLPSDYDAVVMIEDIVEAEDGSIKLYTPATPWQHIRRIGEDICQYDMILPTNTRIEPAAIGAMLAGGITRVKVKKKPVVGLIPTGDEIISPTENPEEGQIIEFNSAIFSAMLVKWNCIPKVYPIVPDKLDLIVESIEGARRECDLVIINAGSSAGREDYTSAAVRKLGEVLVHGIAIRPGKPAILGLVKESPVIGIPGYPVSGIIVMEKIAKRVLEFINGIDYPHGERVKAVLTRRVVSSLKYREFVRVKVGNVKGRLVATPLNRGAGVVTSFVKADAIMEIPLNIEGYEAGTEVEVELLRDLVALNNTLVVIGSHDPLIDIVEDIMKKRYKGQPLSSSHVGSMGGIMALKRTETHLAGIHLLDESTGEYNLSYIERYLGKEGYVLIKGVKRVQGLMVASGNPKQITHLADLTRQGVRYVNRQKGSGTRILLDYLLKQGQISPSDIYGYDREEFTHLAVAVQVVSGVADAGMGILSAARIYDLEFIPICEEQYDFVLPEEYLQLESVQNFLEILKSSEFRQRLEEMGGYGLEGTGEVIKLL